MRIHKNYAQLQFWTDAAELKRSVSARNIVAVRMEPVLRQEFVQTILDIVFKSNDGYVVAPAILLDSPQVILRESDSFVWPAAIGEAIADDQAYAIEQHLFPWIRSLAMGHPIAQECIRHFGTPADQQAFEVARGYDFVGAGTVAACVRALSVYVYAARYAINKSVLICEAPDGVAGAAYLSRLAASITTRGLDVGQAAAGATWFPRVKSVLAPPVFDLIIDASGEGAAAAAEVRLTVDDEITEGHHLAAEAFPMDILFTYDALQGPPVRSFEVHASTKAGSTRSMHAPAHKNLGGSAGRILFGLRPDYQSAPDSDTDSALRLAELLREEGLTVDVTGYPAAVDFKSYDVAHCFNVLETRSAEAFLVAAGQARLRTVVTANFLEVLGDRHWGAAHNLLCFSQEPDEASIRMYLRFLSRKAFLGPGWQAMDDPPFAGYAQRVSDLLSACDVVIAESRAERAHLAGKPGSAKDIRVVKPFLPTSSGPIREAPVSLARFALVHAPIEPRNNQLFVARAAAEASMPVVLAGPIRDLSYAARVREFSGDRVVFSDPSPNEAAWLYEHAAVVVDASWYSYGTARLWRGLLSGAGVVASASSWAPELFPDAVTVADPASIEGIAQAINQAAAPPVGAREAIAAELDQGALLRNVLEAYLGVPSAV